VDSLAARLKSDLAQHEQETQASLDELRTRFLGVGLLTLAVTLAGALWVVHLGLRPLHRLSEAVSKVSEKDFSLPLAPGPLPDELRPIVDRLSQTLALLKRAFEREKQAAADLSHELRTPVAALLAMLDVALRKQRSADDYRKVLEECRGTGEQMAILVERLLALARLEAGADPFHPRRIDAAELAEQCAALVRPLAEARGLTLAVNRNGAIGLTTDPDKLREVITNLLHNAIEYNRPSGRIGLTVVRNNGCLNLEVSDTGIGIPPEARSHLFERFYRADPSRHADTPHAGLGLAIVKGYVDLLGGTIKVDSTVGEGSTFTVSLPCA
jgi:heavy metal sensor kinase